MLTFGSQEHRPQLSRLYQVRRSAFLATECQHDLVFAGLPTAFRLPVSEGRDRVDVDSVRRGIKTRFLRFGESVHGLLRRSVFRDSRRSAFLLDPLALFDQLRETINLLRDPEVMVETLVSQVEFLK